MLYLNLFQEKIPFSLFPPQLSLLWEERLLSLNFILCGGSGEMSQRKQRAEFSQTFCY